MQTLAEKIQVHFRALGRPNVGALILEDYRSLYAGAAAFLDAPYPQAVTAQALFNLVGMLPVGRVLSPDDVGLPHDGSASSLSENAAQWLLAYRHHPTALAAALLARCIVPAVLGDTAADFVGAVTHQVQAAGHTPAFDYAGIVRAGILLAARNGQGIVTARWMARAALLLLDRPHWEAIHATLASQPLAWLALDDEYRSTRDALLARDDLDHERLLVAGLLPRDALVPLPPSLDLSALTLAGQGLGFAWPGIRVGSGHGPLEAAPEPLPDVGLLTHVLLPGLRRHGVHVPFQPSAASPRPLAEVVGTTENAGGWAKVLVPVAERYGLTQAFVDAGYDPAVLLDWACGTQPSPPPVPQGHGIEDPLERCASTVPPRAHGTVATAAALPAVVSASAGVHFGELTARLNSPGFAAHRAAIQELALLADPRAARLGPARVLLIGPSGCGKTTLVAAFAEATGRPLVRVDAGAIVEHGWQGTTPADVAHMVYRTAGHDLERASRAVLVLDEFCKVGARPALPGRGSPSGATGNWETVKLGRQAALLGLLDTGPSTITFNPTSGDALQLPVRDLFIVAAGAFTGLECSSAVGPTDDELIAFGLIPELVARLTSRIVLSPLNGEALRQRLRQGDGGVDSVVALASDLGVSLRVSDEAIAMVAEAALAQAGGLSPRTAAGVLNTAARRALLRALAIPVPDRYTVMLGPDDVVDLLRPWRTAAPRG